MQKDILGDFLAYTEKKSLVVNYVQVRQNDEILAEYQRLPTKTRLNTWSACKSVVSAAAGIAREEGLIDLDEHIADAFPEALPAQPSPYLTALTVRHMLTMTIGLENALFFADDPERYRVKDWIAYFFSQNFCREPGQEFLYCNFNTYMVSCLIEKRAGCNLLEYLRERLFAPIGIYNPDWTLCPKGHVYAANGLFLTIDEMGNFGELLLHEGEFRGRRVLSSAYVREATCNHLPHLPSSGPVDGYGYQFWINPDRESYRADGKLGQYILVLPKKNAVMCVQALEGRPLFPAVWRYIAQAL